MTEAESMHRLAKMALDTGEVSSPEEALKLFSGYRLRIHLGDWWANTLAGQACFLTALNTAVRAFLGGVEVVGDLTPTLRVPLFDGREARGVVEELGGVVSSGTPCDVPTLVLGDGMLSSTSSFCVRLSWDAWCASVSPIAAGEHLAGRVDNPLAGVAAAALGVNEAFLHIRGDLPEAGHRAVGLSLWNPLAIGDCHAEEHKGPALAYLPTALWLVGLGHLGQAYAWTAGMLPYPKDQRPHLVLQDFDRVAPSNLSTCLLVRTGDLGQRKTRLVAERLEASGFTTDIVERRIAANHCVLNGEPTTALFGVDNVDARRDLESATFALVVEAGLGSGYRDFRNIRTHTFPGQRKPSEIWTADATVQRAVELNSVYRRLADERNDECGMTQLASRAVATPFVGALAATLVLAEVIRPLHGGGVHSTLDLQLRALRYRTGVDSLPYRGLLPPFVQVG